MKRGNSNWGKRGQLLKKVSNYQNNKIANNSSIKWRRWTCFVTYWLEKIMDVSTFVFYGQFEIFCRSWFEFLIRNFTVVLIRIFPWLRTRIFKITWSTKIFVRKLMKLMQNQKRFRNKVSSPKEFFQNSIRKRKRNHILVKPSSRF